jgi:hypothetical protein
MNTPKHENQLLFLVRVCVSTFTSSIPSGQRADKEGVSFCFPSTRVSGTMRTSVEQNCFWKASLVKERGARIA